MTTAMSQISPRFDNRDLGTSRLSGCESERVVITEMRPCLVSCQAAHGSVYAGFACVMGDCEAEDSALVQGGEPSTARARESRCGADDSRRGVLPAGEHVVGAHGLPPCLPPCPRSGTLR
jgi:hypothetical protein